MPSVQIRNLLIDQGAMAANYLAELAQNADLGIYPYCAGRDIDDYERIYTNRGEGPDLPDSRGQRPMSGKGGR